ncbi:Lipoprotein-releasing system transmembrane protein LolC [Neolewinella maritima]|uniref:Lipoprotein-releasing system transmembrane protein LolC n=1 Tax=Neolewinella maritima TaxID=1383882 RepID=A0ABM9B2K3_9BACT|nr:FtsX-like permease family protein [Neolewinella maritima]CAH1001380.1 Lipoprotein-releasing system transmembrane protein LolC [Neolewinella maritima]
MNLPLRMAWRYLFARKSTNAINIITFVAAFGVAIGAAALIIALSVFNGFEDIFVGLFNNLNPDVRITAVEGKTFTANDALLAQIRRVPGVVVVSETLEETARFQYAGHQAFGPLKGVDHNYHYINGIDTMIDEGKYDLDYPQVTALGAIVGKNLAQELLIDPYNQFNALSIYVPRPRTRGGGTILASGRLPYQVREVLPVGIVRSQEAFENQAVLIKLSLAREIMGVADSIVSGLELRLAPGFATEATYRQLQEAIGEGFLVRNRFEQENSILKLMRVEKYVAYAIVSLMMIVISFNLVGALWMIVLEKRKDIVILRSLGMASTDIRNVFLRVGLLICVLGLLSGFALASLVYLIQTNYGIIGLPGTLDAYPLSFRPVDFLVVTITVLVIGLIASVLPARRAQSVELAVREG